MVKFIDDFETIRSYEKAMEGNGAHIRLNLSTKDPISLTDFVSNFVGIGNQFEKFILREHPDMKTESEVFVKEVRAGSIEADLVAWVFNNPLLSAGAGAVTTAAVAVDWIDKGQILAKFVTDIRNRISPYFTPKGRLDNASKPDLSDFYKTISSIAHDKDGTCRIEAAVYEDGIRNVKSSFVFKTKEARVAEQSIADHRAELSAPETAQYNRVLMRFVRPSIEPSKTHKRTGERAIIDKIQEKPLAVVYASDMARERIYHEMREAEANIFHLLFDVDVNVEVTAGKPAAYRIMAVHQITEMPEED